MLNPYVGQIREALLDHAIEYFCHGAISPGDDAQLRGFLNGFVASLPGVEAWALGMRNGGRWADAVEGLVESYEDDGWGPLWREHAAFEAIKASCALIIGGDAVLTPLAEDANYQSHGDVWRFLEDEVCRDRSAGDVLSSLQKLMLDQRLADADFLPWVQREVHFLSLLRPEEVRKLRAAAPCSRSSTRRSSGRRPARRRATLKSNRTGIARASWKSHR